MSDDSEGELEGEEVDPEEIEGEGGEEEKQVGDKDSVQSEEIIITKTLLIEEAARCLTLLGKDESGLKYAYLMLDASDRNLTDISVVPAFQHLLFVIVSGNKLTIKDLQCLSQIPYLLLLQCDSNIIESCELPAIPYLQVLTFNGNRIRNPKDIVHPLLECLELNYNRIKDINELNPFLLNKLKVLELRGNLFTDLSGIHFKSLDSLYIAENHITRIEDLSALVNLRVLHIRNNQIIKLYGFSNKLAKLTYLNIRQNRIDQFKRLTRLKCLPKLETLIILQNPLMGPESPAKGEDQEEENEEEVGEEEEPIDPIRVEIVMILPKLKRLNKDIIRPQERKEAEQMLEERGGIIPEDSDEEEVLGEEFETEEYYKYENDMQAPDLNG